MVAILSRPQCVNHNKAWTLCVIHGVHVGVLVVAELCECIEYYVGFVSFLPKQASGCFFFLAEFRYVAVLWVEAVLISVIDYWSSDVDGFVLILICSKRHSMHACCYYIPSNL